MIYLKSKQEIALLREAGRVVAQTHQELKKHIKPGISTYELDMIAEEFIRSKGCTPSFKGYGGFPGSVCISINETLIHGIPSKSIILKDGDLVTIDIGACYKGYHGDSAWSYVVGEGSEEVNRLMEVTEKSLFEGLNQAKPGNRVGDISNAIQSYVEANGYSLPEDYTGHGVGRDVHEDPAVPNVGLAGRGPRLKPGMVIAVEPMVNAGTSDTYTLDDGWTVKTADHKLSCHFEHTIAITEDGYEIMTTL
jgi:methionyl aminopeptidase